MYVGTRTLGPLKPLLLPQLLVKKHAAIVVVAGFGACPDQRCDLGHSRLDERLERRWSAAIRNGVQSGKVSNLLYIYFHSPQTPRSAPLAHVLFRKASSLGNFKIECPDEACDGDEERSFDEMNRRT
jgi:hypothetical protein